jgi:hypothetical protein
MKKIQVILFLAAAFSVETTVVLAQTGKRGEVQDQEFVIRKDRVLTVPTQTRPFERMPALPQATGLGNFNYQVTPFFLNLPALNLQPTALEKNYRLDRVDLYPGYIRAGYGNYASPLLEGRYMSTSADPLNYAVRFKHQSFGEGPVGGKESAESHTVFGADGSYFTDVVEVFGGLSWGQDKFSFYGVNPVLFEDPNSPFETADNVLNNVQVSAGIRDIEKTGTLSYEGQLSFRNFNDSYEAKENEIGVQAGLKVRTDSDWSGKVDFSYFHTNPSNVNYQETRSYFSIRPRISYNYEAFRFTAGVNLISENDSVASKKSNFHVFPVLQASYQFADEFGFYAEFSGGVKRNTYFSFVNENPYLGLSAQLLNTVNNYKFEGGIEGQFQETVHYRAGLNLSRFNQMHFFVNSLADSARFSLVYDDKTTVINLNAELGVKINDFYTLGSRLDLYKYDLSTLQEAWHRPLWEVRINNQIQPVEKLLVQANLNFMGGMKAQQYEYDAFSIIPPVRVVNLKTIADLQLKADFKITDRISIFAEGNNLLNGKNTRWLNYPLRGVQLLGGASFKF